MNINAIIESVELHYKKNPKLIFYNECANKLKNIPKKFLDDNLITVLPKQEHYLESARIHICSHISEYNIYIYNKKKKNSTNLVLRYNDDMTYKLLYQLVAISKYNKIVSLIEKIDIPQIKFKKDKNNNNKIYVVISKTETKFEGNSMKLNNIYECAGYLFGKNISKFLKHQRLDRVKDFISGGGEALQIYENLDAFLNIAKKYDWAERDRFIIFSGAIFEALGTTYTRDVDVLFIQEKKSPQEAREIVNSLESTKYEIEVSVLANDGNWYTKSGVLKYKSLWLTSVLPSMVGAEDIFEIMTNPKFNFSFMGLKFASLDMNIKRFLQRSNVNSLTDLIMLRKLNGYRLGKHLCIPNMTVRQGKIKVFDNRAIINIHTDVQKKLKEYYNEDMPLEKIQKLLQKCNLQSYDIYKGKEIRDPDTNIIKAFHLSIKEKIYKKYIQNVDYLLDIGSGKLTDLRFWTNNHVKNVVGIEPSIESIKKGYERIEKFKPSTKVYIINGVGDVDWNDKIYSEVMKHKYDIITFSFTIHYMINKINILLHNLLNVVKTGTKIIITCMDGNKIHKAFQSDGRVEVRNDQEPIFAIFPNYNYRQKDIPDNDNNILVYFKGAYGVASGSIEPIVDIDKLIKNFNEYGFKLLERKNFLDYDTPIKHKMSYTQKRVSSYYMSIVFEFNK